MFLNSEFCLARAVEARAEVDAARLDNVRNRYLAAETAWSQMAAQARRSSRNKIAAEM